MSKDQLCVRGEPSLRGGEHGGLAGIVGPSGSADVACFVSSLMIIPLYGSLSGNVKAWDPSHGAGSPLRWTMYHAFSCFAYLSSRQRRIMPAISPTDMPTEEKGVVADQQAVTNFSPACATRPRQSGMLDHCCLVQLPQDHASEQRQPRG